MRNSKYLLLISMVAITASNCLAQQKTAKNNFRFHSINNVGLLEGQAGSAFQLETVNGIQYKSWFAGAGVGLDFYRYRTIPLFIDLRKEFGKTNNKFFVYADGGINFYWKRDKDAKQFYISDKFKNGFYGEAAIGYKIKLGQQLFLLLSGGYSYKKLIEEGANYWPDPGFPVSGFDPTEKINYNLNRLVVKASVEF